MTDLQRVAPAFVEMAHRIVWCTTATVDRSGRPRSRILHPYWEWDGKELVGWCTTYPSSPKAAHVARTPYASCNYFDAHDTCLAECYADMLVDDETCTRVWNLFKSTPEPLGHDPGSGQWPGWDHPTSPDFGVLRLRPWRLRVFPGATLAAADPDPEAGLGEDLLLTWEEEARGRQPVAS